MVAMRQVKSPYARPWWIINIILMVASVSATHLVRSVAAINVLSAVCLVSILTGSWLFVEWAYARTLGRYEQ